MPADKNEDPYAGSDPLPPGNTPPTNPGAGSCPSGYEWEQGDPAQFPNGRCKIIGKTWEESQGQAASGYGGGAGVSAGPTAPKGAATYKFDPVPQFNAPQFQWDETFQAPTLDQAKQEPGYQFARDEGLGALQHSQAAQGLLRSGGSLKDLIGWGDKFAEQNYGNVFDRYAKGYDTRLNTAKDKYGFQYTAAKDMYAPNLLGWQTKTAFGTNAAQQAWQKQWDNYFHDTLSADQIYASGVGA